MFRSLKVWLSNTSEFNNHLLWSLTVKQITPKTYSGLKQPFYHAQGSCGLGIFNQDTVAMSVSALQCLELQLERFKDWELLNG